MLIKILRVLKDYNNKQCAVTALIDGERHANIPMKEFIHLVRSQGAVQENFITTGSGVRGKGCCLECKEYLTRDEIWERYPNKAVVIEDGTYVSRDLARTLLKGVVLCVYDRTEGSKCGKYDYDGSHSVEVTVSIAQAIREWRGES